MARSLETLRVSSPCSVGWENMQGDDKVRFCALCKLNVYNFTTMTDEEALAVMAQHEGKRLCGRIYQRADGRSLTQDCGRKRLWRARRIAAAAWGIALLLLAGVTLGYAKDYNRRAAARIRDTPLYKIQIVANWVDRIDPIYLSDFADGYVWEF